MKHNKTKWLPAPGEGDFPILFPILQTSKCIRREALACLTTQSMFEFNFRSRSFSPGDIPFLDHLLNITYTATMNPRFADHNRFSKAEAGPLPFFAGTKFSRKICIVRLTNCTRNISFQMYSPLFIAISRLTGFKEIRVNLYWNSWDSDDHSDCPGYQRSMNVAQMENMVKSLLVPFLGSCSVREDVHREDAEYYRRVLTFHPEDYLNRKSRE